MTRNLKSFAPHGKRAVIPGLLVSVLFCPVSQAQSSKGAPVYKINPEVSKITFFVKASISTDGTFDKWDASLTFTSTDVSTGVLDVKIQAASVDTGSGFKDDKLRSEDFFDVKKDLYITAREISREQWRSIAKNSAWTAAFPSSGLPTAWRLQLTSR